MNSVVKMRLIYALIIFFVLSVTVQMGLFLTNQIRDFKWHEIPISNVLFDLLIVYTFVRIMWRIAKQWYSSRKWLKIFRSHTHNKLTRQFNYKYRRWKTELIVVEDNAFIALTMGMLRPKIVISTGVLKLFTDMEVKAILLHEWYHCRKRDNIKMFISALFVDAFGYLPIIQPSVRFFKTMKELLADRFVIKQMGTELYLGNVLLKLVQLGKIKRREAAIHFTETAIDYRIMQILEPEKAVRVPIALFRPLLLSCSFLLLIMIGGCS
ncbi:M56 family metallopeptidase [Paenibacillus sp. J2TS4]|uniref:M56 family metallopeptidase n=1 Tax=Paenibacillus sp. J2TS4 TaxID=2807194 RepID=UPI001B252ADA|nr:M56 family metallopeptidase [Paenibacillus sp. J2TS4]GIP34465.1 hypothetical protein J2TS4_36750 [Paenibacillus sp. J2TS4]